MGIYACVMPLFGLIYWALPDSQFRIPDGACTDYGSWLYYSIVTITTLGFGDYTPAQGWAQAFTAIEVMIGLAVSGFFLNAVGSMKSEIDVESEIEKQKSMHRAMEFEKLRNSEPLVLNSLNIFLAYCYAVTTPEFKRNGTDLKYNQDFKFQDLAGMFQPSGLPFDKTNLPAVERLLHCASQTSLMLDSMQQRIDLSIWPELLENCFAFVANLQMFSNTDFMFRNPDHIVLGNIEDNETKATQKLSDKIAAFTPQDDLTLDPDLKEVEELFNFIKENAAIAVKIESLITEIVMSPKYAS